MRILFLSPRQVLPALSGAKLREYHFLSALSSGAEVTYLYFSDAGAPPLTVADLPFCREVVAVPKPPAYGLVSTLRGIAGRWPLPILNYTSPAMSAAVAHQMATGDFDIIHLDSIHMIRYALAAAERNSSLKAIYNWHNIESEAMLRFSETTPVLARRWYARHTAVKLQALERVILNAAFGHVVCSERERAQLQLMAPAARIAVVENGVDTAYFRASGEPGDSPALPPKIVFVGSMDYFPNSDAAIFFANQVWPAIRSRLPDSELLIVGNNPGPAVRALGELPGVTVTGRVADVRPYYRQALAAVVPLRTGGGTRLKILEAMAASVPVVSTPLGAEGLEVVDGENALLVEATDTQGWVDHLVRLADSPAARHQLIGAGLRLVQTRYDWEMLGGILRKTYVRWLRAAGTSGAPAG